MSIKIDRMGLEALARSFLPDIIAFFESEEGQREFEEYKRKKAEENSDEQKQSD